MKAFIRGIRNGKSHIFLADIGEGASKGIIKRLPRGLRIRIDSSLVAKGTVARKVSITNINDARVAQQNHLRKIAILESFIRNLEVSPLLNFSKSLQEVLEEKRSQLNCLRSDK